MPHGDFSDYGAAFCLVAGIVAIFAPQVYFQQIGPMKPLFDSPQTPEITRMLQFVGGLLLFMFFALFSVRWNKVNGKAGGLGCFICALNCGAIAWSMDGAFVLRGWHVFGVMFLMTGLHLCFNANPMWTAAALAAKEKERARKNK